MVDETLPAARTSITLPVELVEKLAEFPGYGRYGTRTKLIEEAVGDFVLKRSNEQRINTVLSRHFDGDESDGEWYDRLRDEVSTQ